MKCLNNCNKIVVETFPLLKDVNCSVLITELVCVIENMQLQQSNKDLRILKAGANMNTTPKPHRFWSGFDSVLFIWYLQWSFMIVFDFYPQAYEL